MKVRLANKFDFPEVARMLRNFRNATPIEEMKDCNNELYINKLFHSMIVGGGLALVAEGEKGLVGMIMGAIDFNVWDPEIKMLRELVYWVDEEHRGSSAGYRLLKEYGKEAEKLRETGRIKLYTMTKMVSSPDLDFSKFGYRKSEETWMQGVN